MDSRQRAYMLTVIGYCLDANPRNILWLQAVTPVDLDCLHFAMYDTGVQAGIHIEAEARTLQKVRKRRARKHKIAKAAR